MPGSERDSARGVLECLTPPPGASALPVFDRGWRSDAEGDPEPFLSYLGETVSDGWSTELETLHMAATSDHFIDVWTREAVIAALAPALPRGNELLADLGCSSGLLLADARSRWPRARLLGIDAETEGLGAAHMALPDVPFLHASIVDLPLSDASLDAAASVNVLEHVPDDELALREIRRVLRPGGRAVLVVPFNPGLYDFYDAHLHHERRYASSELADKARAAGLTPITTACLGSLLYPAFWAVKKRNRRRHPDPGAAERQRLVEESIARTRSSAAGGLAHRIERGLLRAGIRPSVGIRQLSVVERTA